MKPSEKITASAALAQYEANLTDECIIQKKDKITQVSISTKGGRVRFISASGNLLCSAPLTTNDAIKNSIEKFVEEFWFWEKKIII